MFHSELSISDWEEETVWMQLRKHECRRTQRGAFSTTIKPMSPLQPFVFWWNFSPACSDLVPAASEKKKKLSAQNPAVVKAPALFRACFSLCIHIVHLQQPEGKCAKWRGPQDTRGFLYLSVNYWVYLWTYKSDTFCVFFMFLMYCCKEIVKF